jgi:hypothetical protein
MRIDTKDKPWQLATIAGVFGPTSVLLAASWRKGPMDFLVAALVCGTLSGLGYAVIWSSFVPGTPAVYAAVSLPILLYVAMTAYFVRCRRRPQVPLVEITLEGAPSVINLLESAPMALAPGARVEARFSESSHRTPGSRFIRVIWETQLLAVPPDGPEETLFRFIEYKGLADSSLQERLCRRINKTLEGARAAPMPLPSARA